MEASHWLKIYLHFWQHFSARGYTVAKHARALWNEWANLRGWTKMRCAPNSARAPSRTSFDRNSEIVPSRFSFQNAFCSKKGDLRNIFLQSSQKSPNNIARIRVFRSLAPRRIRSATALRTNRGYKMATALLLKNCSAILTIHLFLCLYYIYYL